MALPLMSVIVPVWLNNCVCGFLGPPRPTTRTWLETSGATTIAMVETAELPVASVSVTLTWNVPTAT